MVQPWFEFKRSRRTSTLDGHERVSTRTDCPLAYSSSILARAGTNISAEYNEFINDSLLLLLFTAKCR